MEMDPWIQRMLERAKTRGEKLNMQLSNAGHDIKKRRSPLKDVNAILAQANGNKTPTKSPSTTSSDSPTVIKSHRKCTSPQVIFQEESEQVNKENGELGLNNVKSKLQRLGKLYSDDSTRELSSPIHRTEEKFSAEDDFTEHKSIKKGARLDRLAALASTINNWEDDLSHPSIIVQLQSEYNLQRKSPSNKIEKIQAKFNEQVKNVDEPQPSTSGCSKWNPTCNSENNKNITKQLKFDKNVLENLEAQGFSRTKSNTRLVYDYKSCSQETVADSSRATSKCILKSDQKQVDGWKSNTKSTATLNDKKNDESNNVFKNSVNSTKITSRKNSNTPEKTLKSNLSTSSSRLASRFAYNGSPKSPVQSPGSVLSKASMFESKSTDSKTKDPAQMTLSERKALFERNKGEPPLIPKAPLAMSIPPKKLQEKDKVNSASAHNTDSSSNLRNKVDMSSNKVVTQCAIFEQGGYTQELENNILRMAHIERQRELDMLRSRFNCNKEMAQVAAGSCIRTSESSEGKSNSPKNSPICPVKPTPALDNLVPPPPPPPLPTHQKLNQKGNVEKEDKGSPAKKQVFSSQQKIQRMASLTDMKRIRVPPPKPGHLYPNLSEIEDSTETDTEYTVDSTEPATITLDEKTETETETETATETYTEADYYVQDGDNESESDEESEEINTSLGRSILRVVNQQALPNKKRSIDPDPDSTTSDISVLDEMDEYLDECLAAQELHGKNNREEGPTPPKVNKGGKSPSAASTSFKYTQGSPYRSPVKKVSPSTAQKVKEQYVIDGNSCTPLMHTVSFYRRQQSQLRTPKTPVRLASKIIEAKDTAVDLSSSGSKDEAILVEEKMKSLVDEVCKQQTIIGQASQALNLCSSTIEFNGSREQVEGERLLLVATHRRQAALNEIQRLKVEGTLRPVVPGSFEIQDSGSLTVSAISLPLRREYFRSIGTNTCLHFVCLMRHLEEVIPTPIVVAEAGDSCLRFPSTLKLHNLYSDFKITIEIYSLETQAEMLPHEVKYHIHSNGNSWNTGNNSNSKKFPGKTPKKLLKQESRLVMPSVQSPAGPFAVRSPSFQLSGYVIFSLKEVHRQQFTLNKVPQQSPLEGRLQMHVSCEPSISVEHRNFLTMFEYVSGFGIWQRRWCLLKEAALSYWEYPHHEGKKTPIGSLDLRSISTVNVELAPFNICMRPNTLLLETKRSPQPGDSDSLIMVANGSETIIRHLLSADTKEDRLEWCSKLNKTLHIIRAWGGTSHFD